jgi:hypothetical protein
MANYRQTEIYYIKNNDTYSTINGIIEITNRKIKFRFEDKEYGQNPEYEISVTSQNAMNFNGAIKQTKGGNWKGHVSIILYKNKSKDKIILHITNDCTGGSTSWAIAANRI